MTTQQTRDDAALTDAGWVDEILLAGPADQLCFASPVPVDRATLRRLVADRREALKAHGLRAGGAVALRLPPSLAYVANLLASWQLGAQAILLDHRLTDFEVNRATERLSPQVIVSDDLIAEIRRYTEIDGVPLPGERIILLPSMVHVLGLVGGLLYGLHAGVTLVPPERLTGDSILDAVESDSSPATVLGVPFHISLLTSTVSDRRPSQLRRMTTGGELVPPSTAAAFDAKYGVPLGNMYGMTEVGVIGTDLYGQHRPAIRPAPGIEVRAVDGELQIARAASPYLGPPVPERWADGWLRTKDAGRVDPETGLVSILGRLDSQVTIGGLQVDLAEVEHTLNALPGVTAAVVVFDSVISAYLELQPSTSVEQVEARLTEQLASYKLPRSYQQLAQLPRTTTGKLVRDKSALRTAAS
jgi:acyl-coenzyme A synthetase/AMP-(fatty) acid ligase